MPIRYLLAATLVFLFLACNNKTDKKEVEIVTSIDGNKISYNSCGTGDTTLLFVHGWCINKSYWQSQLDQFCDRYKVVAIDLPGFGESGKNRSDWNFDHYTEDIHSVITQLQLKNVVLFGHSMSGDIILDVDNKYPSDVIAIVGVDNLHEPGYPMSEKDQLQTDTFFLNLSRQFDSTVTKSMTTNLFHSSTDSSVIRRVMNDVYNSDSSIAINVLKAMTAKWQLEKQSMQKLSHKLYLINSDVIPVKSDSLEKYCKNGFEVFTVSATGHYPMIEKPSAFNQAILKVLEAVEKK